MGNEKTHNKATLDEEYRIDQLPHGAEQVRDDVECARKDSSLASFGVVVLEPFEPKNAGINCEQADSAEDQAVKDHASSS